MQLVKRFWVVVVLSIGFISIAQAEEVYRKKTFQYYLSREMNRFQEVIESIQSHIEPSKSEQLEMLEYYYGMIGFYLDIDQKPEASKALKRANSLLDRLQAKYPGEPIWKAYKSIFLGFEIAISPLKAPRLYLSMVSQAKAAYKEAQGDPMVNLLYGNILFYMPEMFGGDLEKSLGCYQKALAIYEANPELQKESWIYLQLLTTIGLVNEYMGHYVEAKKIYTEVLKKEPNHKYVRTYLYPRLMKKMKG